MNVEELRIPLDNTDVSIIKFGNGPKSFVILPGLSVLPYNGLGTAIASGFKIFTPDYTCYFIPPKNLLPQKYSLKEVTEDTYRVIKKLGLSKVDFSGFSMGGMLCMIMAIEHPEIVNKISLASTTPCLEKPYQQTFIDWISLAKSKDAEKLFDNFGQKIYSNEYYQKYADALTFVAKSITDENLTHFITLANAILEFDIIDNLSKIKCPVQYLGAKGDKVLNGERTEKYLKSKIVCYESYLYDGYSHAVNNEAPDFCHRIIEFFKKA